MATGDRWESVGRVLRVEMWKSGRVGFLGVGEGSGAANRKAREGIGSDWEQVEVTDGEPERPESRRFLFDMAKKSPQKPSKEAISGGPVEGLVCKSATPRVRGRRA